VTVLCGTNSAGKSTILKSLLLLCQSQAVSDTNPSGQVAEQRGVARAQLVLAWLLSKPVTSPIVGATKPHHLQDAVAALSLRLTAEEVASLEEPYAPHPVLGFS
jgi:aryl-alcohol dehydrogenase-like predicted oxidoreductase